MVMLEHDDTLHTRHGIERVMYRGRYVVDTVLKRRTTLGGAENPVLADFSSLSAP